MEIITAGDGTAHVSSADDGAIYAGIIGQECYVTGIGDKLSCTMQGANTALVGTGVGLMYGRAWRVSMPEEVTIQSGTQSQRRNDIICAHFTTSSDGHESGELVVLKGTPTSGQEAEDPEIPSGDILEGATEAYMPLWRIPLDGINVGDPEPLFDVLMSMAELRDSVSQPSEWVQLATGCWYAVKAGWCCVSCEGLPLTKGQQRLVGRLPVGAPSGHNVVCPLIGYDSSGGPWAGTVAQLTINAAGNVFGWTNGATGSYQGTVCFPVG